MTMDFNVLRQVGTIIISS